jgi:hypothetical protein
MEVLGLKLETVVLCNAACEAEFLSRLSWVEDDVYLCTGLFEPLPRGVQETTNITAQFVLLFTASQDS